MGIFEIDDPSVDVDALEERVRAAIEAKRGVRFTAEELDELRSAQLAPRLRREDLPRGWLDEMPEARSQLPEISPPPGGELTFEPGTELYGSGAPGLRGTLLRLLRRLVKPFYSATTNQEWVLMRLGGELGERISDQGAWAGRQMTDMSGQLERWRERDLHLYHNLVAEMTALRLQQTHMQDRINELVRQLDMPSERERALEALTVSDGSAEGTARNR